MHIVSENVWILKIDEICRQWAVEKVFSASPLSELSKSFKSLIIHFEMPLISKLISQAMY